MSTVPSRDALDDKVNRTFAGKVVRKDLVRKVKVGANVPGFVLEFLLGKYCASTDEMAIQMGLQVVNDTLANNYIRADEAMKAQSKVKEKGTWTVTAQVGWMAHERRRDLAKFEGSLVRAPMMFEPCFLAVEKKERMTAKSIAPSNDRNLREINGKITNETRFYITSLVTLANAVGPMIRAHWAIENSLHWVMDMVFRDDECRVRTDNAPANFATCRHIAYNL